MKRLLELLCALCLCHPLFAVKVEDRYVMKAFEGGQLYFVLPFDIPSTDKQKDLSADITYLTNSDSVTLNITVRTPNELAPDSIVLQAGEHYNITDYETFYIERDNNLWVHRYSLRFPMAVLKRAYTSSAPYTLTVFAPGQTYSYAFAQRTWQKEQDWMNRLLHIIDTNRRLYTH